MELSKNIIKKLTIEVEANSMADGLQIKNDISGFLNQHVYPKLETFFDQNIPENELWKYENLEFELDVDVSTDIKNLAPIIISKLTQTFQGLDPKNKKGEIELITSQSLPKSCLKAFLEFLDSGQYPWWYDPTKQIKISDFTSLSNAKSKQSFIKTISKTNSFNRLIYQFDFQFITNIFKWSSVSTIPNAEPIEVPAIDLISNTLKKAFWQAVFSTDKVAIISFFKLLINEMSSEHNSQNAIVKVSKPKYIEHLKDLILFCNNILQIGVVLLPIKQLKNSFEIALHSSFERAYSENIKHFLKASETSRKTDRITPLNFVAFSKQITSETESKLSLDFLQNTPSVNEKDVPKTHHKIDHINDPKDEVNYPSKIHLEEEISPAFKVANKETDGTLVQKAGLILLHPFLKHFFINMNLSEGKKIRPEKQDLAVHLLHYIASKEEQPSEHEVFFEKYLCNIPSNQPIDKFISLSTEEKKACDELLQAALKHWSSLRTNAIDALRSEFLMRQGKLSFVNDTHRVFIERKTQDILLDTLPWNLHLVKLPWKEQLLYVEW